MYPILRPTANNPYLVLIQFTTNLPNFAPTFPLYFVPHLTIFFFQQNFVCRSVEYNYVTLQCRLSDYDRRTPVDDFKPIELVDAPGIDYFENLCLVSETTCADERSFSTPRVGVPDSKIALHVNVHFYTDKELMVSCGTADCDIII